MKLGVLLIVVMSFFACSEDKPSAQGEWIVGEEKEKITTIETQFRGFDMTMVETGYRYQELYWAGQDENWEYAQYQIQKIRKTINNGLQRRPKRSESAQHFLDVSLPEMERAIDLKDTVEFDNSFNLFTNACNNCHAKEQVPFFSVQTPTIRQSPIRLK